MVVTIKPLQGLLVRDPNTKAILPESGMIVSLSGVEGRFWRRRIADGSVIVVQEKKEEIIYPKKGAK
jgi:predicted transcriptional regulator